MVQRRRGRSGQSHKSSGTDARTSIKLSSMLDERLILCGMKARDKQEAIEELASLVVQNTPGLVKETVIESVLARERECTTAIGRTCAFPHGKIAGLDRMVVALGISNHGIECDAIDSKPVNFMVLILTGEVASLKYLATLAAFASLSREPEKMNAVLAAKSPREVIRVIERLDIALG